MPEQSPNDAIVPARPVKRKVTPPIATPTSADEQATAPSPGATAGNPTTIDDAGPDEPQEATEEMADAQTNDDLDDDEIEFSPKAIAVALGLLVVVVLGIFLLGGGSDDEDAARPGQPAPAPGGGGSLAPPPEPAGPKVPVGSPPGEPTDNFDAANGVIGPPWESIGTWERKAGTLVIQEIDAARPRQFLVRDIGSSDGTVSAVATLPVPAGAVVFRYVDEENHWLARPAGAYATWAIVRVTNGEDVVVASTGISPTNENTTITVEMNGPEIRVKIDGQEKLTLNDAAHQQATKAGFATLLDRAILARWDNFYGIPAS